MFPTEKVLSQQIKNAIKMKWGKQRIETSVPLANNIADPMPVKNSHTQNANTIRLNRIQRRLKALEELNDQLYYHLCFLIENLPELITKTFQSELETKPKQETLIPYPTRRENDVLNLLEKGYCAKEIATKLFISETTVVTHKKNLKKKFNVKNTVELISKIRTYKNA